MDQEISELLEKGAIQKVETANELLSNIFLVGKDRGNLQVMKKLDTFIPNKHFKMEGLHCLKFLLEQSDFLCELDLKDASQQIIIKICEIQVVRQPLRVSLSLFRFRASSKSF